MNWIKIVTHSTGLYVLNAVALAIIMYAFKSLHKKISQEWESDKKQTKAMTQGVKAILYFRICREGERILNNGHITRDEIKDLQFFVDAYQGLGGNGVAKKLYNECMKLPIKESTRDKAREGF